MNGGLMKTTSRFALAAIASVFATGAMAADLGGSCCADLEERIAELEATTVRKGNRKVSLTVSGWVHKEIMFWDDGKESNTYAGVDNINASTRFRLTGDAKITPTWSAGYLLEIEAFGDFNSSQTNQLNGTGANGTTTNVRHSAWWIDNKQMGRVWVGLTDPAGAGIDGINLANTNFAANAKVGLNGGGFGLRGSSGGVNGNNPIDLSARTWSNILMGNNGLMNLGDETRLNVIKYVSPTVMGFIFAAAWGEDDFWDVSLKYAGEHHGFRVAAGATYNQTTDANVGNTAGSTHFAGCADLAGLNVARNDRECESWVIAGSLMHVGTGLFVTSNFGERKDSNRRTLAELGGVDPALIRSTDRNWSVRGGIERNWTGLGNTTLFGEFNNISGTPLAGGIVQNVDAGLNAGLNGLPIVRSEVDVWGLGMVQSIDAAAMDLYIAYRNFSADVKAQSAGALTNVDGIKDFQLLSVGGVIRF
jgi:hypothetical protein